MNGRDTVVNIRAPRPKATHVARRKTSNVRDPDGSRGVYTGCSTAGNQRAAWRHAIYRFVDVAFKVTHMFAIGVFFFFKASPAK